MAYEIAEQLGWSAPDYVLCPVGAGSILLGLFDGFSNLLAAGVVNRLPRLVAVQAGNVSAVCAAVRTGAGRVEPARDPQPTLAEGIALPAPVRDREVLQAIRGSGGTAVSVGEGEIAAGAAALGRAGFCVETDLRGRMAGAAEADRKAIPLLPRAPRSWLSFPGTASRPHRRWRKSSPERLEKGSSPASAASARFQFRRTRSFPPPYPDMRLCNRRLSAS